jgi:hypothetical protein
VSHTRLSRAVSPHVRPLVDHRVQPPLSVSRIGGCGADGKREGVTRVTHKTVECGVTTRETTGRSQGSAPSVCLEDW